MSISLVGVLPVSALNIGMTAGISALQAKITKLQADISNLQVALTAQATVSVNIPDLVALTAAIQAQIAALPSLLIPQNILTGGVDANADIAVELGLIELQIALVGNVVATFQAGLNAGSLSLWTYSGRAAGFGTQLEAQTKTGWGGVPPETSIQAIIIGSESFESWGSFSASFNTGSTSSRKAVTSEEDLEFVGVLRGDQLNTGVLKLFQPINLFLLELEAAKINLLAQLQVSLGINLPDITALQAGLNVDIEVILENMINIKTNLGLEITGIQLQIEFILQLILELSLTLSAGGLAFWIYSGPASGLGTALKGETTNGIPSGSGPDTPAYGVVVACEVPSAWADFGLIFQT